jgi:hypothetical protein
MGKNINSDFFFNFKIVRVGMLNTKIMVGLNGMEIIARNQNYKFSIFGRYVKLPGFEASEYKQVDVTGVSTVSFTGNIPQI